jgi:hypothetical protein
VASEPEALVRFFGDRPGTLRVAPGGLRERLTFQH